MTLAFFRDMWYSSLTLAGVLELVDEADSKASTSTVSEHCLTLDFSTGLSYNSFSSFESSLLGSLLSFDSGETKGSETVWCIAHIHDHVPV